MDYGKLALCIGVCLLAGFLGSFFTASSVPTWYAGLEKPFFNPPSAVFGPVWTFLYILMGISLYLVWTAAPKPLAIGLFSAQLLLNFLWSVLFFGLRSPLLALIEIALLWVAILLTIIQFHKVSRPAAYLLIPYILWVSFAAVLNYSIYALN